MTAGDRFLRKAQHELSDLLDRELVRPLSSVESYRALVLVARLRQSPEPSSLAAATVSPDVLAALAARCTPPDATALMSQLQEALAADEEPFGRLLDALLDVDDLVGILLLQGDVAQAHGLAADAGALVLRDPARTDDLAAWAHMRAAALSPDAPLASLWARIAAQRAAVSRGSLPSVLLPDLPRAAASTADMQERPLPDAMGRRAGECYIDPETGDRMLDLELPSADSPTPHGVRLHALDRVSGVSLGSEPLDFEREGRDVYISLGPDAGPRSVRHILSARIGVRIDDVRFEVRFDDADG